MYSLLTGKTYVLRVNPPKIETISEHVMETRIDAPIEAEQNQGKNKDYFLTAGYRIISLRLRVVYYSRFKP